MGKHRRCAARRRRTNQIGNVLDFSGKRCDKSRSSFISNSKRSWTGRGFGIWRLARRRPAGRYARLAVHTKKPSGCLCFGRVHTLCSPSEVHRSRIERIIDPVSPSREHRSHPREKLQLRPRSSQFHVRCPYLRPLRTRQDESAIAGGAAVRQVHAASARKDMSLCLVLAL